ncbi:uncharacterized protein LOC105252570 [Camponotus floridanus]|uniref:uncharacterized protein LOC105252570 n=1 Tax=Camponotus floridanus TaxID=104421 RepID=UPI00059C8C2A|nr:uncharacterized protein LOC105252570 [Camponotus floridanus]
MVRSCCICRKLYGTEGITFHSIPTQQDLKLKWIDAIGKEVSKYACVCNQHFKDNDIMFTGIKKGTIRRRLHFKAVPTLHLTKEKEIEYDKTNIDFVKQACVDETNQHQNFINPNRTSELQDIENTAENVNTDKRRDAENKEERKRCHVTRYVGDFNCEDFTSDRNWKIFRKYYKNTSKKLNILQGIIRRRDKKIKELEALMDYLKRRLRR